MPGSRSRIPELSKDLGLILRSGWNSSRGQHGFLQSFIGLFTAFGGISTPVSAWKCCELACGCASESGPEQLRISLRVHGTALAGDP